MLEEKIEKNAYKLIEQQIRKAKGSKGYFPRQAFYEAKGMLDMAYHLGEITKDEFLHLDTEIVRNGINNPEYFD
ncbi:hypothetical protein [Anaerocolumna sp.]|uniref:hypothetical protein n=1 Tax=Anaerocolumna sp. TaxID=2041569 RepID=UPI0028B1A4B9|nr:hypothetical protein [Anaerocolumna sp.]